MIEQRYDTLEGLSAPILIYETYDEAEAVVKDGLKREGNNNMVYRGVLPCVRDLICTIVEGASSVERKSTIVGKTKAGKDIVQWETEGKYVKRAMAEKGWNDLTQFQTQLDDMCRNYKDGDDEKSVPAPLAVDLKGREYAPRGPVKLAAKYKETAANSLMTGSWSEWNNTIFKNINKSFTPTNDSTVMFAGEGVNPKSKEKFSYNVSDKDATALGWLVKEYLDWNAEQGRAAL